MYLQSFESSRLLKKMIYDHFRKHFQKCQRPCICMCMNSNRQPKIENDDFTDAIQFEFTPSTSGLLMAGQFGSFLCSPIFGYLIGQVILL